MFGVFVFCGFVLFRCFDIDVDLVVGEWGLLLVCVCLCFLLVCGFVVVVGWLLMIVLFLLYLMLLFLLFVLLNIWMMEVLLFVLFFINYGLLFFEFECL